MNRVILLVGHGSRGEGGNEEIEKWADLWREQNRNWNIQVCFIEFAEVLLKEGLDRAAQIADEVIVVPLILNAAGHVKMEIPEAIAKARKRNPNTIYKLTRHLGATEKLLKAVRRMTHDCFVAEHCPDPKTTGIILLGRGSSDKLANGEVAKMARWLFEVSEYDWVDYAFTGITYPRLESAVKRHAKMGMTQVFIVPYYLFTGRLILRIQEQHQRLKKQYPEIQIGLASYFGFEPEIFELMNERVTEVIEPEQAPLMLECDGCEYRSLAAKSGHHHDHDHSHDHEAESNHDHAQSNHEHLGQVQHIHEHT